MEFDIGFIFIFKNLSHLINSLQHAVSMGAVFIFIKALAKDKNICVESSRNAAGLLLIKQ